MHLSLDFICVFIVVVVAVVDSVEEVYQNDSI